MGAVGYSDFTIHKDEERKLRNTKRHNNENWTKSGINSSGFWSRWFLWNLPTISSSYQDIKKIKILNLSYIMNVNITGIYDSTVIVVNHLFEDVRLLQTGLSSLSDTLFNVVEGLPYQYANLTSFTILSNDHDSFKINNTSNLSNII